MSIQQLLVHVKRIRTFCRDFSRYSSSNNLQILSLERWTSVNILQILKKYRKMNICLQKSASIQPRTGTRQVCCNISMFTAREPWFGIALSSLIETWPMFPQRWMATWDYATDSVIQSHCMSFVGKELRADFRLVDRGCTSHQGW